MSDLTSNINEVLEDVRQAAARSGRDPAEIGIVAVTKTVPVETVRLAVSAGLLILGENRVQELTAKYPLVEGAEWHLIGHLQRNKVKYITDKVSLIHSLDSAVLAEEINRRMSSMGRVMDVLVQVNIAEDPNKYGIKANQVIDFVETAAQLQGIRIRGLMTIGPYVSDPEEIRPVFRELRKLAGNVKKMDLPGVDMRHLSMGMSNDYIVAIEEGATLVRIGSAIFGTRK
ncbi:YggS family pyridoxal phosphate-dependent enzyme [Phosphitispora fastidiosa]|uniref:YggS family pyridoxal phosphate-dependent enzyme n=1 Tax=Phosphitispora fastidiosa TaxID=2837202 RepID=UPI001E5B2E28|nr:YggS family pyridoxal phosphate-dependent enzyme [Phosphitispora fastidiosa]MBU7008591.1 pyridoxal phosphate enzyme (YggS family) [Phosphitispora fastidiosa]